MTTMELIKSTDIYTRMFDVCGTPQKEVVERMCKNANMRRVMDAHLSQPHAGVGIETLLPECSDAAMDLLKRMLIFDNQARVSAAQAFQHPFVQPGPKATIDDIVGHESAVLTARAISRINLDLSPSASAQEDQLRTILQAIVRECNLYPAAAVGVEIRDAPPTVVTS
jgi:serine/threonine protein kinase